MQFSVIVPVYNVEKYLEVCVQSILNQSFHDYELILIDDGSSDSSGNICDEYAKNNERIKVIHQDNGGLSCARNTGIKAAAGDYLIFIDSDDWIDSNALEAFDRIIVEKQPEVIETKLVEEYEDKTVVRDQKYTDYLSEEYTRERALNWILYETEDTWPAPKRICDRQFILDHNLLFAEGRLQEDIDWTTRLCCCAESFAGYDQPWYHYRMKREGSISNSIHAKYITDVIEMAAIDRNLCDANDVFTTKAFNAMMCSVYIAINLYKYCNEEDKRIVSSCIKKNRWIFDYTPTMKYKLFAFGVKHLGVDRALTIISFL